VPYPSEHAARIINPGEFQTDSFRRKSISAGIDIIIGKLKGKTNTTTQAYRFKKSQFTADQAKAWLKKHKIKYTSFEAAAKTKENMTIDEIIKQLKGIKFTERVHQLISDLELFNESDESPMKREAMEEALDLLEAERMSNDTRELLRNALKAKYNDKYGPYLHDFSDSIVIYTREDEGKSYQINYTIDANNKVTFGDPVEVVQKTVYEPVKESVDPEYSEIEELKESAPFVGDIIPLLESQIRKDGTIPIKIIQPGWGDSGYYPSDVLKRDAGIYKEGTKMYLDHPTVSEERERPERSVKDLAGVLISNGTFKENGHAGPGVYATAKIFSDYAELINEKGPHIGVSHVAYGKAKNGEAEGKTGRIIESLKVAASVDFVTTAGAGGKITELFESLRNKIENMNEIKKEDYDALKESNQKLSTEMETLKKENQRMKEAQLIASAKDFVAEKLKDVKIHEVVKNRLIESVSLKAKANDKGDLDKDEFTKVVDAAVKEEIDYLSKITESGKIKGMGDSSSVDDDGQDKKFEESITKNINAILGKPIEQAEK